MAKVIIKTPMKEKVVEIYDAFIRGEDPTVGNSNFWDEFFLLRANVTSLEDEFEKLSWEDLKKLKKAIHMVFYRCIIILKDESQIRIINSIQTMCALVRGVHKVEGGNHEAPNLLLGYSYAEQKMKLLVTQLTKILLLEYPRQLKTLTLKFLLILVTVKEDINMNKILDFLMINNVFEPLAQMLKNPKSRLYHGYDALLLLTILVNYQKYEITNPYIVKLSIVDSELTLVGFGQVIISALTDFNRNFCHNRVEADKGSGLFSSLSSFVGNMFVHQNFKTENTLRVNNAVLLAFYEGVHLNRNFLTALINCQPDWGLPQFCPTGNPNVNDDLTPPLNLMVIFLEFCSAVMQNTKDEAAVNTCKLCFIILTCIAEDPYANSILHDVNIVFKVHLHKMPMRHRRLSSEGDGSSRPLSCSLMDLMIEFILSHMTKNFPFELYYLCLGVIQRILTYQKRSRVRLEYAWKDLWTALISLLKFINSQEEILAKSFDIFFLACQVVNVLNIFITFGDTFLPSISQYDDIYYEIMRMKHVFDHMYSLALRYTTIDGEWKESAACLTNHLVNIRAIINHFSPKIEAWSTENHISALTEEQVMHVVKNNYDTLLLKLCDNLDRYEKYSEEAKQASFFAGLVCSVVSEYKHNMNLKSFDMQNMVNEFSSIT